jgi:hypothetical protein
MKKFLFVLLLLIVVAIACIYIFIPSNIIVSALTVANAPVGSVYRCVNNEKTWQQKLVPDNSLFKDYTINSTIQNAVDVVLHNGNDTINTKLVLIFPGGDSTIIHWDCSLVAGTNPFSRLHTYNTAVEIKKSMDSVLSKLRLLASDPENIYGLHIDKASVKDTVLISTKTILDHYPATNEIYNLVNKLNDYAIQSGALITGNPMYNITPGEKDTVRLMVALPVNKLLPQHNSIIPVRMVPGNFLSTQVSGGEATVRNALAEMQNFITDNSKTSMAIPFSYLVTNRMDEPDTTKWITQIYLPVY